MVKIEQHPEVVYDRVYDAARVTAQGVLEATQTTLRKLPAATGALAASYRIELDDLSEDGIEQRIVSDLEYASAIEHGAWVRGGPGPHISGSGKSRKIVARRVKAWVGRMNRKLRE